MIIESVSKKIKALLSKTVENGCSESEALSSAKKAQELLNKHGLSMSEIEYRASDFETLEINTNKKSRDYMYRLINSISYFTDCYSYYNHGKYSTLKYIFFGEKTSTEVANFMFDLLKNSIEFETNNYKNSEEFEELQSYYSTRTILNSFRTGMAIRLAERLREIKSQKDSENVDNKSIILYDRMDIVYQKFNEMNPDMNIGKANNYRTNISKDAFNKGKEKANDINITTGIKRGEKEIKCLS